MLERTGALGGRGRWPARCSSSLSIHPLGRRGTGVELDTTRHHLEADRGAGFEAETAAILFAHWSRERMPSAGSLPPSVRGLQEHHGVHDGTIYRVERGKEHRSAWS